MKNTRRTNHAVWLMLAMLITASNQTLAQQGRDVKFDSDQYGGKLSFGVGLLGGGLAGVNITYYPTELVSFEGAYAYRPILVQNETETIDYHSGNLLTLGANIYFKKGVDVYKSNMVSNGLFIKGGLSAGFLSESLFALGWAKERFRIGRQKSSYTFNLGAGFTKLKDSEEPIESYGLIGADVSPLLYLKFQWNFYAY